MRRAASFLTASLCLALAAAGLHVAGCDGVGGVASEIASVHGLEHSAYCDRRFIKDAKSRPTAFCQEVIDTVAAQRFIEDCESKFGAKTDVGRCPTAKLIAGCRILGRNDDDSTVYDWYYDVRDLEASDAGRQPDGGPTWLAPPRTPDDVKKLCADPSLYDKGATFISP